jgi:hypothetical protein
MTQQQLIDIETYAGYFFSPDEIVCIMQLATNDKHDHRFKNAYKKGKLMKEAAVRKSIIDLAVSGSSPAQALAVKFIENSKLDEAQ